MKKFFKNALLAIALITPVITQASVRSAAEQPLPFTPASPEKMQQLYKEIPSLNDPEALKAYLAERLKIVTPANVSLEEAAVPSATSVVDVEELRAKQQDTLTAYEKIYEQSLERAQSTETLNQDLTLDGTFYKLVDPNEKTEPFVPDFPYVTIKLSEDKEIIAPAEEHIAYLLTGIKIEPTGLINVTEEFVFVSNNLGFPTGFFRILPKYTYSRSNTRRRLDVNLNSVTINGEEFPYKITEVGSHLYIEPQKPLDLPTGIYTYRFSYTIDRAVWFYDNFAEIYWDITAQTLKNVVGSANAVVSLPQGSTFLAQNALVSTKQDINPKRVTITTLNENSLAFADTEALAVGDDIHLFLTLDKNTLLTPDFTKKYFWFIQDHGAVLFALLALIAIFTGFKISLNQIRRNQDKTKASIKKTPALFRLFNTNQLDERSLLAEMLNLCAKNICMIQKHDTDAVLIKKTDDLKKLSKFEKKLLQTLFPNNETACVSDQTSALKLKRAFPLLKRETLKLYYLYALKLNALYLFFSFAMLLCGMIGAATIAVNPVHTFWVILGCTLLFIPFIFTFTLRPKSNAVNLALKAFSTLSLLSIAGWLSIYTSNLYAAVMIVSIWLIIFYYQAFSRRNGLLRNKIKETEEYKSYLQKNPELAVSARDFPAKMPYIYAFGLENKFKNVETFELITCYQKLLDPTAKKD
ncbi:MAG: DUF2207 domain-containing protein [Alphaproteobacteria bacterium]|nr:DUF2207 domain-containing protein [Alphaproteobacteria bacterium]